MEQQWEHINMIIEDYRDSSIKTKYLAGLIKRYANFKHRRPRKKAMQLTLNIFIDSKTNDYYQYSPTSASVLSEASGYSSFCLEMSNSSPISDMTMVRSFTAIEDQYLGRKKICEIYSDTNEEYEIIRQNFMQLYYRHKNTDGSRLDNNNPQIHI